MVVKCTFELKEQNGDICNAHEGDRWARETLTATPHRSACADESLQIDAHSRCGWGATKWPAVSKTGCKVYLFGIGIEW